MPVGARFSELLNNPLFDTLLAANAAGSIAKAYNEGNQVEQQGEIAQSVAQGAPLTTVPRRGLSGLIAKTGLISPTTAVDPNTQALETLAVRKQQEDELANVLDVRGKTGPTGFADLMRNPSFAGMVQRAGISDTSGFGAPTPKESAAALDTQIKQENLREAPLKLQQSQQREDREAQSGRERTQIERDRLNWDKTKPDYEYTTSTIQGDDGSNRIVTHQIDKRTGKVTTVNDEKAGAKGSSKPTDQQTRINAYRQVHPEATDADALDYIDSKKSDRKVDERIREMQVSDQIKERQEARSLKSRESLAAFTANLHSEEDINKILSKPQKIGDGTYKGEASRDPATGQPAIKWTNQTPGLSDKIFGPSPPIYTPVSIESGAPTRPTNVGADWNYSSVKGKPAWVSPDKKQAVFVASGS
jgi:hypothetical protein